MENVPFVVVRSVPANSASNRPWIDDLGEEGEENSLGNGGGSLKEPEDWGNEEQDGRTRASGPLSIVYSVGLCGKMEGVGKAETGNRLGSRSFCGQLRIRARTKGKWFFSCREMISLKAIGNLYFTECNFSPPPLFSVRQFYRERSIKMFTR